MSGTLFTTDLPSSLASSLEASKCEYRRLGSSGLKVSVPILGAMSFGDKAWLDWMLEEEEVCLSCFSRFIFVAFVIFSLVGECDVRFEGKGSSGLLEGEEE